MNENISKSPELFYSNIEKSIAELERNWENVVIRYITQHSFRGFNNKDISDEATPKAVFAAFVNKYDNGIIHIQLPDWNFEWACSIIALAFDRETCGLDEQLAIYKHNLNHPNKNVAWKTYIERKTLGK